MASIERHLHLYCNKWDTQVGDERTIAEQALIVPRAEWEWLCASAEKMAAEVEALEVTVMQDHRYQALVGVPKPFSRILDSLKTRAFGWHSARAMRFDFHPTAEGWRVSEVNSDVPGGWREASTLPLLYHPFYPEMQLPPSPLSAWGDSVYRLTQGGLVALLSASGYLEDQQVIRAFADELVSRGTDCVSLQSPAALRWSSGGMCSLRAGGQRISAVVRFFQAEWIVKLPRGTGWEQLLDRSEVPVLNPTICVVSESKRFPLVFDKLSNCRTLKEFVPECRDPWEVPVNGFDDWVLKVSYSNTGDEVHICGALTAAEQKRLIRKARKSCRNWVAQKRFETCALTSARGLLYPCIGIFVVDGRAAGAYVRLSKGQVTDGFAIEAPLLIDSAELQ